MAKQQSAKSDDDVTRPTVTDAVEHVSRARHDYFHALYEAWKEMGQQVADAQRRYEEKLASIFGADDVTQAQNALYDASRAYSLAVQFASISTSAAIGSELAKYTTALDALTTIGKKTHEQVRDAQQDFMQQLWDSSAALHERYAKAFRAYVLAHDEAHTAAADAPGVAHTLAQQLLAISSHAAWLQRSTVTSQHSSTPRAAA